MNKKLFDLVYNKLETELPSFLTYHNLAHTQLVVENAQFLAREEGLKNEETNLVLIAALFHDTGFMQGRKNHEEKSCNYARKLLPEYGFSEREIQQICKIIGATKIPQQANTNLEKIMADADLFYLGTNNYKFFSEKYYQEIKHFYPNMSDKTWLNVQKKFLLNHIYHTDYGKTVLEPVKRKNLLVLR